MPATRLICGCGYLGARVAERWRQGGDQVYVVTRNRQRAALFETNGLTPIVADVTDPESLNDLPEADTVLFAVGYDRGAGPSIFDVYEQGFRHTLSALSKSVRRVIYISTTGIYGGAEGAWVDESTTPNPQRDGGRASLAAEQALQESSWAEQGVALRLAGIYGPDRLPYLDKLRRAEPIEAPRQGWLNLIHVDDAASAVVSAAEVDSLPPVICVSDGAPAQREDYYHEAARLLGATAPQFADPPPDSPRAARAAADKRVSNRLMIESLGIELLYPSYREGLAAILA